MFGEYVFEKSNAAYEQKVLLLDDDGLERITRYASVFAAHGFEIVPYKDDLSFRLSYTDAMHDKNRKLAIIGTSKDYIPYDVMRRASSFRVTYRNLFPKLNDKVLTSKNPDLDLLTFAYRQSFDNYTSKEETEQFLRHAVYGRDNLQSFLHAQVTDLEAKASDCNSYRAWFGIAEEKAKLEVMAAENHIALESSEISRSFQEWVLQKFGTLSTEINHDSPVLVSRAMEFMHDSSDKYAVIVVDGMSEFDWRILSRSFNDISYEKTSVFAMIPTVTSVSRQCLLSNKYPTQLQNPWSQAKEKNEFIACAKSLGYNDSQIAYARGYDADIDNAVRCAAVIVMDIDDLVHGQIQGREGMANDIGLLAHKSQLAETVKRLSSRGFDVYITADHGNTHCKGLGRLVGSGVETETRSHRMVVLKDIADVDGIKERFGMIEYPKYYLPKNLNYLMCDVGTSLDVKNEDVMSHGGMEIDEVIVPFIKIKAVKQNEDGRICPLIETVMVELCGRNTQ